VPGEIAAVITDCIVTATRTPGSALARVDLLPRPS
jgi:hypothetical protein